MEIGSNRRASGIARYVQRVRWKYLHIVSRRRARKFVERVAGAPHGPFSRIPPEGYMRGIDFYGREQLIQVVENILAWYRFAGCGPLNLIEPRSFSEKLNNAKLFAAMKVPETGNKSLTSTFIPDHLEGTVRYPEVVWRSPIPELPGNDQVPPGLYYLKTTHGSGWVRRIEYPLSRTEKADLEREFAGFLLSDYGYELGEWWYNTFDRELMIEKAVSKSDPSTVLLFYVIGGEVGRISVDQKPLKRGAATKVLVYDGDFNLSAVQRPEAERLRDFDLSDDLKKKTLEAAREIGKQFACVRVDLMVGDDGEIYLNELTHMSSSGRPLDDRKLDYELGQKWEGQEIYLVRSRPSAS